MANGASFINVLCSDEFKQDYKVALAKEGKSMKEHVIESAQQLIDKHKGKDKKKK